MADKKKESMASKGGKARAAQLTTERLKEIARSGGQAKAMVKHPVMEAKYGAPDRPLRIGATEIPCFVLADGRRVLAQRGLHLGLGLSEGGGRGGARKLAVLMNYFAEKGIDTRGLSARANNPIRFRFATPHGGFIADGYEASILPDICAVVIDAATQGKLHKRQLHLARQCAMLQHGFATVGIIALVDEATGYQEFRARDGLAQIIEAFVAKELKPWVHRFPIDYFKQICRLNDWDYNEKTNALPSVVGHYTNNIVYNRLAPGVLDELRRLTPRNERGRLKHKLHQWLTEEIGHPKLLAHLSGVIMLMKYSDDWKVFMERMDKEYPPFGKTLMLPWPADYQPPKPLALPPGSGQSCAS